VRPGLALEWPSTLDIPSLIAEGWNPLPFTDFVIKLHSRCDLSCDYCYMYEMADQSWRERPARMSAETASHTALRIADHAREHCLPAVTLILHGGEPLLAGPEAISRLVTATRAAAGPGVRVNAKVQTNAIGLSATYLKLFDELGILVGVSLDGSAAAHDRHRRFASGRGSHEAVSASLSQLTSARYRHLFSGLLCTVDISNDPVETYEALAAFEPPAVDFLLPHGTWESPPPARIPGTAETPYADWLIRIFDHWYRSPATQVRLFADIMHLILGGKSSAEMVGLAPSRTAVIETDGAIELSDILKVAYHGAPRTGLNVATDPLNAAMSVPGVVARQLGRRALSAECQACNIWRICGGGLYAHRYRAGSGFANPSVYCPDLMRLISHIRATMQAVIHTARERRAAR